MSINSLRNVFAGVALALASSITGHCVGSLSSAQLPALDNSTQQATSTEEDLPTRLVLCGGGEKPLSAINQFLEWAGGKDAKLMILPWSSGCTTEELLEHYTKEVFSQHNPNNIYIAPSLTEVLSRKNAFLQELQTCDGIVLTGGDQNRTANFLESDTEFADQLLRIIKKKVVFATSAGSALSGDMMFTGEVKEDGRHENRSGLGLIPNNLLVDTHFNARNRHYRMLPTIREEQLGLGINEDHAVAFDGRKLYSCSSGEACRLYIPNGENHNTIDLGSDQSFDLKTLTFSPLER